MIQEFVDRFMDATPELKAKLKESRPSDYDELVRMVVDTLHSDDYGSPDPGRITVIDHGGYQGTRLYIVGADGYQPSTYWSIFVSYGSCSGCDTFQANRAGAFWDDDSISDEEVNGNWTMMLHMVQSMKVVGE